MCRLFSLIIGLCLTYSLFGQRPVLYGERSTDYASTENSTRVFLDRNGDFYPDIPIPDDQLLQHSATLEGYFKQNEAAFKKALLANNVIPSNKFSENFKKLQTVLIESNIEKIARRTDDYSELYILIHGFRKPLKPVATGTNSLQDYDRVKEAIIKHRPEARVHFLEVYWDGTYISVKPSLGGIIRLGKLFKRQAIPNAIRTGEGLRQLISKIDHPQINIIAHSLGAQVVNNLLWNADVESLNTTPAQKIEVCLIAPAIARKPFRKFLNRPIQLNSLDADNYAYSIIYNERDIVVAKSNFGKRRYFRFTRFFGNTKLGCNCSREAIKVSNMFRRKYPNSPLTLYDATEVGNNHRWGAYVRSAAFIDYMNGNGSSVQHR